MLVFAVLAGLVVLVVQVVYWLPNHATRRDVAALDVSAYYCAALHVARGEPMYGPCTATADPRPLYIYPPPLAISLAPLTVLGVHRFQFVWYSGILVGFWLYALSLIHLAGLSLTIPRLLIAGAILQAFPGTSTTMSFGNIDIAIWALCAFCIARSESATMVSIGAVIKLYPGWLFLTGDIRRAVKGAAVAAIIIVTSLLCVGIRGYRDWLASMSVVESWTRTNISLSAAVGRVVGLHGHALILIAALGVPLAAWVSRKQPPKLRSTVLLIVAVLLAPVCWWHYAPMLLMPLAATIRRRISSP